MSSPASFTPEQDAFMIDNYKRLRVTKIARLWGVSTGKVSGRAYRLGINHRKSRQGKRAAAGIRFDKVKATHNRLGKCRHEENGELCQNSTIGRYCEDHARMQFTYDPSSLRGDNARGRL